MLQIAVCGDEASVGTYIKAYPGEYIECEVHTFANERELYDSGQNFDILLSGGTDAKEQDVTVRVRRRLLRTLAEHAEGEHAGEREAILIRSNGTSHHIERGKVLYAENVGRKVALHTEEGQITYYARMKEVEELLGDQFFRCHRGYLVNLRAIRSYETGSILLKNGERILMAKQKYNDFVRVYAEYLHGGHKERGE